MRLNKVIYGALPTDPSLISHVKCSISTRNTLSVLVLGQDLWTSSTNPARNHSTSTYRSWAQYWGQKICTWQGPSAGLVKPRSLQKTCSDRGQI